LIVMDEPGLLRVREAAEILGISQPTLYSAIRKGKIRAMRIVGMGYRILEADLERFRKDNLCPADVPTDGSFPEAPDA